jgi:predicted peptidase
MKQQPQSLQAAVQKEVSLKYLMHVPNGYADTEQDWPLMLFLHGMGERGNDLDLLKLHGIPKVIEAGMDLPFLIASPQCPADTVWANKLDDLHALLEDIIANYRVARSRIYLTGLSMGGYGTWHLAAAHPELFAAIAPICGWMAPFIGFPERVQILKDMPVWAFHGAKDEVILLERSQELVDVLIKHGGDVRFTIYPKAGHDSLTETYENPELYEWLLQHKNDNFQMSDRLL